MKLHVPPRNNAGNSTVIIITIIVLALGIAGIVFVRSWFGTDTVTTNEAQTEDAVTIDPGARPVITTSPTSDTTTGDTTESAETADEIVEIEMEAGGYYYTPNTIRVQEGQTVRITMNAVDMMHDFVIDELDVQSEIIREGEKTVIVFTPDQAGEFEFYCSVNGHRAAGMVGTLIVE